MKNITLRIPRAAKVKNRRLVKNLEISLTYQQYVKGEPFRKVKSDHFWWRREILPGRNCEKDVIISRFEFGQTTGSTTYAARVEEENGDRAIISGIDTLAESFAYRLIFKK